MRISVDGFVDSDVEERVDLAAELSAELLGHDVTAVEHPSRPAPDGAKGPALEWAELVVSFAGSVAPLIGALRTWSAQRRGASITIEIEGDRLVIEEPTSSERRAALETWMRRHGAR